METALDSRRGASAPARARRRVVRPFLVALLAVTVITAACDPLVALDRKERLNLDVNLSELPVPPTVPNDGVCTAPTGCVSADWGGIGSPGFMWDPTEVLVGVTYAGAPPSGPSNVYTGPQVIVVKTDGSQFPDGNGWTCLTCGVPAANQVGVLADQLVYIPPRAVPGDKKIMLARSPLHARGHAHLSDLLGSRAARHRRPAGQRARVAPQPRWRAPGVEHAPLQRQHGV